MAFLGDLDDFLSEEPGIDLMDLGEIRVPLNALCYAIVRRRDELLACPHRPTAD